MLIKAVKVQLSPNNKQKTKMFDYAGAARFAYNWTIARQEENYKQGGKFLSDCELRREFTQLKKQPEYCWLNNISNNVTKQAIKDACGAYKKFFTGLAKHPRFKTKRNTNQSFYQDSVKIKFTNSHVKLEGISNNNKSNRRKLNWVKLCEKNMIPTNCKYYNPRITFDGLHWWVSVGIESNVDDNIVNNNEGIGIDLGIEVLAYCSDKTVYKNINKTELIKKIEKKKRRLQRSVSRKYQNSKEGNGRYCKTRNIIKREREILKLSKRLKNIRDNYTHQMTTEIIKRKPNFICVEDLDVSSMMKNRYLSKSIQEQRWYEVRRQLEYKSKWNNINFIVADRYYPSSKTCHDCGFVHKGLKLSDRVYKCPNCGNVINRDYQASLNLKRYGEIMLA